MVQKNVQMWKALNPLIWKTSQCRAHGHVSHDKYTKQDHGTLYKINRLRDAAAVISIYTVNCMCTKRKAARRNYWGEERGAFKHTNLQRVLTSWEGRELKRHKSRRRGRRRKSSPGTEIKWVYVWLVLRGKWNKGRQIRQYLKPQVNLQKQILLFYLCVKTQVNKFLIMFLCINKSFETKREPKKDKQTNKKNNLFFC